MKFGHSFKLYNNNFFVRAKIPHHPTILLIHRIKVYLYVSITVAAGANNFLYKIVTSTKLRFQCQLKGKFNL